MALSRRFWLLRGIPGIMVEPAVAVESPDQLLALEQLTTTEAPQAAAAEGNEAPALPSNHRSKFEAAVQKGGCAAHGPPLPLLYCPSVSTSRDARHILRRSAMFNPPYSPLTRRWHALEGSKGPRCRGGIRSMPQRTWPPRAPPQAHVCVGACGFLGSHRRLRAPQLTAVSHFLLQCKRDIIGHFTCRDRRSCYARSVLEDAEPADDVHREEFVDEATDFAARLFEASMMRDRVDLEAHEAWQSSMEAAKDPIVRCSVRVVSCTASETLHNFHHSPLHPCLPPSGTGQAPPRAAGRHQKQVFHVQRQARGHLPGREDGRAAGAGGLRRCVAGLRPKIPFEFWLPCFVLPGGGSADTVG